MNITYDKIADAMYLYFQKGKKIARTVELADLLVADLDRRGKVIGVEVLCASRQVGGRAGAAPLAPLRRQKTKSSLLKYNIPLPVAA